MSSASEPGPGPGPGGPAATRGGRPLASGTPLFLLPVRIETRFADLDGEGFLLLRVYPDTISVSSFEAELTQDEVDAGRAYWDQIWSAGRQPPDQDALQGPWRVLAGTYQPQRAAWIALQMRPVNAAQIPGAPTPPGQEPSPPPDYPTPAIRASSYEQAPTAQALPRVWSAILSAGSVSRQVTGTAVQPGLAVGLTPHDGTLPDGLPVDAAMRWLVDFDAAVAAGMGLRIPLSAAERAGGFDRIIVAGLCDGTADGPGNTRLAALLDAHHYTDGIAFVPQGAPTNNTPDASSAYSRQDPGFTTSFLVERCAPLAADPAQDGPVAAALLGLPAGVFDHVQYADARGVSHGRDMVAALWPATLGYFLDQMLAPVLGSDAVAEARSYALANAVPRGSLPALRVGNTPYGLLPVTSLAAYQAQAAAPSGPEAALVRLLRQLLPAWQSSVAGAPHIGASNDPDQDLAQVLGMDASSVDFRGRQVIGDDALWNILRFLQNPGTEEWWAEHVAWGRVLLDHLGLASWDPRVIHTAMGRASYPVPYPTVQDGALSETAPLASDAQVGGQDLNYIQWLGQASVADIQDENYPGPVPTSLLYQILRQSVLRVYVGLAAQAQVSSGALAASALREAELVNIQPSAPTITPWDIVSRPVTPGSAVTWAQYLHDLQPAPESPFAQLADLRTSLAGLAVLPTAELDRLLTETLDACSHRLDVWISAVATAILQRQRAATRDRGQPRLHLGGYGWLENIRPAATARGVTGPDRALVARLDEDRQVQLGQAVLQPPGDNGGFIHAPSMTQAAAGAILRSGYLSHRNTPDEPALAIDLSSDRTRLALWLLDGVRQGQALGALVGYQFEQALHGAGLDVYVQPFRDKYPLIASDLTPQTAAGPVIPPSQVVDGVALRAGWQAGDLATGAYWGDGLPLPAPPQDATQNAVLALVEDLDDMLAALGDLSLAESVFQIMRGNFGRAGGMLSAISRGDQPPQPDVVNTPRDGIDVTHRLLLLFAGPPSAGPGWGGVPARPRAAAEPWLSDWIGGRLPDPDTVRCTVSWVHAATAGSAEVTLSDLGVGPLDVLALAAASTAPQRSELENRILYAAAPPPGAAGLTISYDTAALAVGSVGFPDLLTAVQALQDMLGAARPLTPQDFSTPETSAEAGGGLTDLDDLNARAGALLAQATTDSGTLQTTIANLASDPQAVRDALIAVSFYGIAGAIPQVADDDDTLTARAAAAAGQLQQRLETATQSTLPGADLAAPLAIINALLPGVLVLPRVTPPPEARSAFAQSAAMSSADPQALDRWMLQLSHIRPAADRYDLAMTVTGLLGAPDPPGLTLGQLPEVSNDRWLGLPIDPAHPPASGRVAIEAMATGDPSGSVPLAGLLLDEWLDRIPAPATSAGLSFHYAEPTSRAPQALLLAVCPDDRATWDLDLVQVILAETLTLAKLRAVDLNSILEVGQILPGLYFPFNLQAATIAAHLLGATRDITGIVPG